MKQDKLILLIFILVVLSMVAFGYFWYTKQPGEHTGKIEEDSTMDITDLRPSERTYSDLSPSQAAKLIEETDEILIVDVSPHYDKGHLLNSVNYYVGGDKFDKALDEDRFDPERVYLVYCHVDSASIAGAEKLVEAGMKNVYRLAGNYSAWVEAGYPVIKNLEEDSESLKGELNELTDSSGSGVGYILRDTEGLKYLVKAGLPDLTMGEFYEGWLVDQAPELKFFSTGKMTKTPEEGWILEYVSDEEYSDYDYVVITKELIDDGVPEIHIIEGSVK